MALYRNFETQEAIDREYGVEAGVPDFTIYADLFVVTAIDGFLDPESPLFRKMNKFMRG